jgi:hypothetical protein
VAPPKDYVAPPLYKNQYNVVLTYASALSLFSISFFRFIIYSIWYQSHFYMAANKHQRRFSVLLPATAQLQSSARRQVVFLLIFYPSFQQPPNSGRLHAVKWYTRSRSAAFSGDQPASIVGTLPAPPVVSARANRVAYAPAGATRSTPSDISEVVESRVGNIWSVQASTRHNPSWIFVVFALFGRSVGGLKSVKIAAIGSRMCRHALTKGSACGLHARRVAASPWCVHHTCQRFFSLFQLPCVLCKARHVSPSSLPRVSPEKIKYYSDPIISTQSNGLEPNHVKSGQTIHPISNRPIHQPNPVGLKSGSAHWVAETRIGVVKSNLFDPVQYRVTGLSSSNRFICQPDPTN